MFGGRYFAIRDRLGGVVDGIEQLARSQEVDSADLWDSGGASVHPMRPLRLVLVGETNSGKSSLLNALFGTDVCDVGELPSRLPGGWYGARGEVDEGFRARDLPGGLDGKYEWIDPPGINGLKPEQRGQLAGLCKRADAVLAVFQWTNPWEPATWDFIYHLGEDMLDRVLIVLQQTDRGEAEDLPVVLNHLAELSQRRVGRQFGVFPVSAKIGRAAWSAGRVDQGEWERSGCEALERKLDEMVSRSTPRFDGIHNWWHASARVVRRVEEQIDGRARLIEDEAVFLGRIESMVEEDRDEWFKHLDDRIDGIERAVRRIRQWLGRRLGLLPSFVRCLVGDDTATRLDGVVIDFCAVAWRLQATGDVNDMQAVCRDRWERLEPQVKERLGVDMGDFASAERVLVDAGERFIERFVDATATQAREIRPGAMLAKDLRRRQRVLAGLFSATLAAAAVAGTLGALDYTRLAWCVMPVAAALLFAVVAFSWLSRQAILREVEEDLADALTGLGVRVRPARLEGVRLFFAEFLRTLDGLRRRVAASRSGLQPTLYRCNSLFLQLQAVGQQLHSSEAMRDGE